MSVPAPEKRSKGLENQLRSEARHFRAAALTSVGDERELWLALAAQVEDYLAQRDEPSGPGPGQHSLLDDLLRPAPP